MLVFIADETHERCEGCGQLFAVMRSLGADVRPTRCPDCVAQTTTTTPAAKRAPAGESFSIHSLVGDTTSQCPSATAASNNQQQGHRSKHTSSSSKSSSPFLVQAAAAHAQYYALAASGLLPALNYGGRSTRVASMPLDWASSTGLAAKHRYGV